MIKLVMFDMDDTINNWDSIIYSRQIARLSGLSVKYIDPVITRLIGRLDPALITIRQFESIVAKKFKVPVSKISFVECYKRNVKVNAGMIGLIKRLRRRYKTGLLTNSDRYRYPYTAKIVDMRLFNYRFASGYIGIKKPDPRMFGYVIRKTKEEPDEILFIDNNIKNVKAARRAGIKSIQFVGVRRLERDLGRLGIWRSHGSR